MKKSAASILFALALFLSAIPPSNQAQTENQSTVVKLNLIVVDRNNHAVDDVQKEDLQLFDNGTAQTILSFSREEVAAKYGIVIDTSGSLRTLFPVVKAGVMTLIQANRPDDTTFITRFISSDQIHTVQPLTNDKAALTMAINGLAVRGGQTAVIDGLYLAAEYAAKHRVARERLMLVLISDGEDRASYFNESQLLKLLRERDIQIFALGLIGDLEGEQGLIRKSPKRMASEFLTRLAKETGGRAFLLEKPKDLPGAIDEIAHDIHSQYVIEYQPTERLKPERKIEIKLTGAKEREKRKVITRAVIGAKPVTVKTESKQP
ncbi:MAG TPA: VWA domain-containing protein [Pyrinomonadaceae bacterium]